LDKPEVLNTGGDDWDDIPSSLEYEKAPELSSVRIVGVASNGTQPVKAQKSVARAENSMEAMSAANKGMQSDAPACNVCGHITVRSGTCYKCLNCGNSLGCS
jgi:ribonucleoside-diphosphate reductase alpha chain